MILNIISNTPHIMESTNPSKKHRSSPSDGPSEREQVKKVKKTEDMEEGKGEQIEYEDEYEDVYGIY